MFRLLYSSLHQGTQYKSCRNTELKYYNSQRGAISASAPWKRHLELDDIINGGWSLMLGGCVSGLLSSIRGWPHPRLCSTGCLWLWGRCELLPSGAMCCCVLPNPKLWCHPTVFGDGGSRHVQKLLISPALLSLWPSDVLWCGPRGLSSSLLCTYIHSYMEFGIPRWTFFPMDLDLWPASTACEGWMRYRKSSGCYNVSIPVSHPCSVLLRRGWRLLLEALQLAQLLYGACWMRLQFFLGNHSSKDHSEVSFLFDYILIRAMVRAQWKRRRLCFSSRGEGGGKRNASIDLCELASGIHWLQEFRHPSSGEGSPGMSDCHPPAAPWWTLWLGECCWDGSGKLQLQSSSSHRIVVDVQQFLWLFPQKIPCRGLPLLGTQGIPWLPISLLIVLSLRLEVGSPQA